MERFWDSFAHSFETLKIHYMKRRTLSLAFLFLGWLLYLVTLGFAGILLVLFFPYVQLNQAYLMGRYYGEVVDPLLKDDINESTLSEAHRNSG